MEELRKDLHKAINGKRYLLVLDDVWNEDDTEWQNLKELLAVGAKGTRIILTTRSERVAMVASTIIKPYYLGILDDEKSWSLFRKMAFKRSEEPENSSNIVEIGKKIVQKCRGVPLAIKAIGRILYFKNPETEWLSLVEQELHEISQNKNENIVLQTLKLSYDHLPSHLKHCLIYCSLFPKNYEIEVEMLIQLWMTHGLVKSIDQTKSFEETGYEYFMELLWRSFFQEVKTDMSSNVVSCKMHDLMHDLAESLVERKCIKLGLNKRSTIGRETRYLSFDFQLYSPNEIQTNTSQSKRIRSIFLSYDLFLSDLKKGSYESFCKEIVPSFKLLRFLDLHRLDIGTVPNCIGELKYLRYLDFSKNTRIETLPKSITRLFNLQTLKLNGCRSLKELPIDIKRPVNLRHLETDECIGLTHMPSGLNQLTNLQTLSTFVLRQGTGGFSAKPSSELNELVALKLRNNLTIKNLRHEMDSNIVTFDNKIHIRSLNLIWTDRDVDEASKVVDDHHHEMTLTGFQPLKNLIELSLDDYGGVHLPGWLPSTFSRLVKLGLYSCKKLQHLPQLNQFCSLKILELVNMPVLEYVTNNGDSFEALTMPCLRILHLWNLPNLKSWWRDVASRGEDNSFPAETTRLLKANNQMLPSIFLCLSDLTLANCPQLNSMPLYPCAEYVRLNRTSWKPLKETILMKAIDVLRVSSTTTEALASTSSAALIPTSLSKLKFMHLESIANLQSLNDVKSLTSLKELEIERCPELKYLASSIQHLSSLQRLKIEDSEELMDISKDEDPFGWQGLRRLRDITLCGLPN